ncbi:hypothetical protein MycrhDRAFT_6504 [Mycolicibacterium rhodesiae JS60]|nr:hypothetical protein MycrhDRAFT_6504 [Mycolicibacterium rhodesiae JS60]
MDGNEPVIRTTISNRAIRIADLTVVSDLIQGVRFENCNIIGPAVIGLLDRTVLQDSAIDGDTDAVLWDLGDRVHVIGAVGLMDCIISNCRLQRIGFAVPRHMRQKFMEGLNIAPERVTPS